MVSKVGRSQFFLSQLYNKTVLHIFVIGNENQISPIIGSLLTCFGEPLSCIKPGCCRIWSFYLRRVGSETKYFQISGQNIAGDIQTVL